MQEDIEIVHGKVKRGTKVFGCLKEDWRTLLGGREGEEGKNGCLLGGEKVGKEGGGWNGVCRERDRDDGCLMRIFVEGSKAKPRWASCTISHVGADVPIQTQ